jgi:AAA domain-containing protein
MTLPARFEDAMLSTLRTIASAAPDVRLLVFAQQCREAVGWSATYGVEILDRLQDAAVANDLVERYGQERIQTILADAVSNPFRSDLGSNMGDAGKPRGNGHGCSTTKVTAVSYIDFLNREFPPRALLLDPWLTEKAIVFVHGWRGIGKTLLTHASLWAVAVGGGFLTWKAPQPRRVLLLDGEMPGPDLQQRLRSVVGDSRLLPPDPSYLRIAAADTCPDGLPDIARPDAQQFYADVVSDADLVVLDNISTLCPSLKENDADSWATVQSWALSLRRAGKSVLLVNHDGKSGQQRGTSRREDVADAVIGLRKPPDYSPDQGARFEVHFEKSRGFFGDQAKSSKLD